MSKHNGRNWFIKGGLVLAGVGLACLKLIASPITNHYDNKSANLSNQLNKGKNPMKLGAFSISLTVKDINASKQFYEQLGFNVFAGSLQQNYLIMKNGNALIGLFQGMFEKNILTFNPGWDENANKVENFDDVRDIQRRLKSKGIKLENEVDENTSGPGSLIVLDPDGNPVLVDQHI